MGRQLLVYLIVGGAGLYLGRQCWLSLRALRNKQGGCGSGCGKCGSAKPIRFVRYAKNRK